MHASAWSVKGPEAGVSPSLLMSHAGGSLEHVCMMGTAGYLPDCARQIYKM